MATITADWTGAVPIGHQTTQPMIIQRFLESTGMGEVVETSSVSDDYLTCSELQNGNGDDQWGVGGWVRASGGTSANLGEIRPIQHFDPANGVISFAPPLPAATADGDTFEVWLTPVRPKVVLNLLDRLTSQHGLSLPAYSFLSEIPDFDMEQSGTSAWSGTNATLAKVPWAAGVEGVSGKQALSVTTTSANGYATCQRAIGVKPGASLWVSAQFTPSDPSVTNTGFLQLVDSSGNVIEEITTTSKATVRLQRNMSASENETLVNVRFGSQESGVVGIWDEVVLLDAESRDHPLPYWMRTQSALKDVYVWKPQSGGGQYEHYDPAYTGERVTNWTPYANAFGSGQLRIKSETYSGQMLFVQGARSETAWQSLTEVKHIDIPWAAAALALHVYERIIGQYQGGAIDMKVLMERRNYWADQYQQHNARVMSRRRTNDSGPTVWVMSR